VAGLSLVIAAVVLVVWIRGYVASSDLDIGNYYYGPELVMDREIMISWWRSNPDPTPGLPSEKFECGLSLSWLGFGYRCVPEYASESVNSAVWGNKHTLTIPYWGAFTVALVIPCLWLWQYLRSRNENEDVCRHCGYDLRASGARCPECGQTRPDHVKGSPRTWLGGDR
jgi:hypothetical protein